MSCSSGRSNGAHENFRELQLRKEQRSSWKFSWAAMISWVGAQEGAKELMKIFVSCCSGIKYHICYWKLIGQRLERTKVRLSSTLTFVHSNLCPSTAESTPRLKCSYLPFMNRTFTIFSYGVFSMYIKEKNPRFASSSFKTLVVRSILKTVIFWRIKFFQYWSLISLFKDNGFCASGSRQNLTKACRVLRFFLLVPKRH